MELSLATLIVRDYDRAIDFFTGVLGFELVDDSPSTTNDGRPKRWVEVRPPGAATGLLLARADGATQEQAVGNQVAGRVGFFLRVDDFDEMHARLTSADVTIVRGPFDQDYGRVLVFEDLEGNRWDLLGPPPSTNRTQTD
ncbi:MAG: VOC family protein [Ilumatobacter sp.]